MEVLHVATDFKDVLLNNWVSLFAYYHINIIELYAYTLVDNRLIICVFLLAILQDLGLDTYNKFEKVEVTFGFSVNVDFGNDLVLASVQSKPKVNITTLVESTFQTLVMVDADGPNRVRIIER